MNRAIVAGALVGALCVTGVVLAKKRADAGSFVIRYHDVRRSELNHPALVQARRALWNCWQASRPCEVSLSREFSLGRVTREDALLDVSSEGVRSILLRVSESSGRLPTPRRYTSLERIPLLRGEWDAPALSESDASGPEHWRLRFAGGDFVRGAGGEESGPSDAVAVW